jgi:hypothetical protein
MKVAKVLCALLVCGSPACELSVAVEADPGARHVEKTHESGSANDAGANQGRPRPPPRDSGGTEQRAPHETRAEHGHDTRAEHGHDTRAEHGHDTRAEHGHDTRAEHGHDTRAEHGHDTRAEYEHASEPAEDGDRAGHPAARRGSAHTGRTEEPPRQMSESRGRTLRSIRVRLPPADRRIASHAGPHDVSASREQVATADVAERARAVSGLHAANRASSNPPATVGAGAVGGPHPQGSAFVGGPAPPKGANSAVINGTAARRRF